jgi:hypothetical protein
MSRRKRTTVDEAFVLADVLFTRLKAWILENPSTRPATAALAAGILHAQLLGMAMSASTPEEQRAAVEHAADWLRRKGAESARAYAREWKKAERARARRKC